MKHISIWIVLSAVTFFLFSIDRAMGFHALGMGWMLLCLMLLAIPRKVWVVFFWGILYDVLYAYFLGTSAALLFGVILLLRVADERSWSRRGHTFALLSVLMIVFRFIDVHLVQFDLLLISNLMGAAIVTILLTAPTRSYTIDDHSTVRGMYGG